MSHVHMLHIQHTTCAVRHTAGQPSQCHITVHECLEYSNKIQIPVNAPIFLLLPVSRDPPSGKALLKPLGLLLLLSVQSAISIAGVTDKQMVWTDDSILPCGILHCWPIDPERSPSIKEIACWRLNWLSDFYQLAFLIHTRCACAHMCCQCGGLLIPISTYH